MSAELVFTDQEQITFRTTLAKRWNKGEVDIQLVDVEVSIAESTYDTIECPAFYWEYAEYRFLLMKTDKNLFRPQFFYQDSEEIGAETLEFDDIAECAMALLKLQVNHNLSKNKELGTKEGSPE